MNGSKQQIYLALLYHATWLAGDSTIQVKDIFRNYDCKTTPEEFLYYICHKNNHDFVNISKDNIETLDRKIQITLRGMEHIEGSLGDNVSLFLEQNGITHVLNETGDHEEVDHDSELWTGVQSQATMDDQKKRSLINALKHVDDSLDDLPLSNAERAQARAYIVASICLADTPDPPADLIWEMLERAAAIAGIASLLVSVFALLKV